MKLTIGSMTKKMGIINSLYSICPCPGSMLSFEHNISGWTADSYANMISDSFVTIPTKDTVVLLIAVIRAGQGFAPSIAKFVILLNNTMYYIPASELYTFTSRGLQQYDIWSVV